MTIDDSDLFIMNKCWDIFLMDMSSYVGKVDAGKHLPYEEIPRQTLPLRQLCVIPMALSALIQYFDIL